MSFVLDANSVLLGTQEPRYFHAPESVSEAEGESAIECAAAAGLVLDPWQAFVLRHGLGERSPGVWAARECGVCVPRQNGKGGIIEALELYWLFVLNERLVIHSAHLFDTSKEAMRRLVDLIDGVPEFKSRVEAIRYANGQEGVYLKDGSRIRFKTRTKGGGRGLTGRKVILDEAMYLPDEVMAALMPTISAVPDAQMWYFGSAVDQMSHEHGRQFARLRERGLARRPRLAYFEWSSDIPTPDEVPDEMIMDRGAWASANPAFGIRITDEAVQVEADSLPARTFAVERLGVGDWPSTGERAETVVDLEMWRSLTDRRSEITGKPTFTFDVSPERRKASISVTGRRPDGFMHTEVIAQGSGTDWVPGKLAGFCERWKQDEAWCDSKSPAATLVPDLAELGVKVKTLTTEEYGLACGRIVDEVAKCGLRHIGQPELEQAIRGAAKRALGDRFAWSRKDSTVDITGFVASTVGVWVVSQFRPKPARIRGYN